MKTEFLRAVAKNLRERMKPDDVSLVPEQIILIKLELVAKCLFAQCHKDNSAVEVLGRCINPGGREFTQLKLAVRSAFEEVPGEDKSFNYLRSYGKEMQAAILHVAKATEPATIMAVLEGLNILKPIKTKE